MAKRRKGIQDLTKSEMVCKTPEQLRKDVEGLQMVQCADCIRFVKPQRLEAFKKRNPESFLKQAPKDLEAWYAAIKCDEV